MLKELQEVFQDKNAATLFRIPTDHDADFEDLAAPSLGLPADCVPKPHNRFLVLKPQIALRSEAGENAIVLLTVEEISFRGFSVLDEIASDAVSADVLNRCVNINFVRLTIQELRINERTASVLPNRRDLMQGPRWTCRNAARS